MVLQGRSARGQRESLRFQGRLSTSRIFLERVICCLLIALPFATAVWIRSPLARAINLYGNYFLALICLPLAFSGIPLSQLKPRNPSQAIALRFQRLGEIAMGFL